MNIQIRKAERKKAKLRLGIAAPSGAGKTYGALQLAFGLGDKIGLIDTENGSGDLYANIGDYDVITLSAPYTVPKYLEAIRAFEQARYDVIIIDSLSHAWAGEGGLLDKQGKIAERGTNSYAAWRTITPEHNSLVEAILGSTGHVIATMRSKQEYVLQTDEKGKQVPKKVGMAPIQRDGMEYEFTVMLDIDMSHQSIATKDRTQLFDGQIFKITQETGRRLLEWLEDGTEISTKKPHEYEFSTEPHLIELPMDKDNMTPDLWLNWATAYGGMLKSSSDEETLNQWVLLNAVNTGELGHSKLETFKKIHKKLILTISGHRQNITAVEELA